MPIQLRKQDGNDEASWLRKSQVDKHPTLELATREVANPWWYSYGPSSRDGFKPLRASTSTRLCAWNSPWARSEQGTLHPNAVVQMRPQKRRTKLPPLRRSCDGWQFQCPYAEVRGWNYVLIWVSPCRYCLLSIYFWLVAFFCTWFDLYIYIYIYLCVCVYMCVWFIFIYICVWKIVKIISHTVSEAPSWAKNTTQQHPLAETESL